MGFAEALEAHGAATFAMGKKKGGKKGKKGKVEYLLTEEALAPFDVKADDIINTPLGVTCTVHGVMNGSLYLKWPGGLISPATTAPTGAQNKAELNSYGYSKRPESASLLKSIEERQKALYAFRRGYNGTDGKPAPAPKTAHMRLPLGPAGQAGTERFQAFKSEWENPGSILRPASAPAKSGGKKK